MRCVLVLVILCLSFLCAGSADSFQPSFVPYWAGITKDGQIVYVLSDRYDFEANSIFLNSAEFKFLLDDVCYYAQMDGEFIWALTRDSEIAKYRLAGDRLEKVDSIGAVPMSSWPNPMSFSKHGTVFLIEYRESLVVVFSDTNQRVHLRKPWLWEDFEINPADGYAIEDHIVVPIMPVLVDSESFVFIKSNHLYYYNFAAGSATELEIPQLFGNQKINPYALYSSGGLIYVLVIGEASAGAEKLSAAVVCLNSSRSDARVLEMLPVELTHDVFGFHVANNKLYVFYRQDYEDRLEGEIGYLTIDPLGL